MIDLKRYQEAMKKLPEGAVEAEVNAETHDIVMVTVCKQELIDVQCASQTALFVRVSGEKTGYVYTQNLEEDAGKVLAQAYANSALSDKENPETMNRLADVQNYGDEQAVCDAAVLKEKAGKIASELENEIARQIENRCREGKANVTVTARLKAETYGQHTVNSHGLDVNSAKPVYILSLTGELPWKGAPVCVVLELASGDVESFDLEYAARNLAERIVWQMDPVKKFESGDYPVILSDEAVYTLFATGWQEFSACKYADGASALAGSLGEKIAGEVLSIVDDPDLGGKGFPMSCDAEGSKGEAVTLLDHGIFTGMLHNTSSAERLSCANTGNAGRRPLLFGNIATDILVTPKNFCFQPGTSSLRELEEHMGNGILITEYMDVFHTLDVSSGEFSAPCFGVRIEDGKETENLTALTVSGNFRQMLSDVLEVGRDHALRPMIDLENYGIAPCALRVASLNVSGE
ncbi:MAG: metallopeptidase TldD-related protein [Fusicatenibacter sp.]|nr:metallopeptidase TldD-related protein [Lachnospiraceae bacterium]MDY2939052.1 metallopeptidase TldD-related protein [Fusicatenibacter sp.]